MTISNIPAGNAWSLNYSEVGVAKTITGTGSGIIPIQTSVQSTAGSKVITLISISNTTTNSSINLTGQSATLVVNALPNAAFSIKYNIQKKLFDLLRLMLLLRM